MGANIIIPKNGGGQSIWEGLLGDKTFDILSKDIYGVLELRDYVFANKNITHAELSPMIQTIGENAFKNCSQLIDVTIPNSVTRIKADAFSGCSQLSTIYFRGVQEEWDNIVKDNGWDGGRYINVICMDPTSLTESNGIIQGLSGLVQDGIVVIPPMINGDTITSVGYEAFGLYANIKEIIFPRTITELPYELFTVYQSRSRLQTAVLPEGVTRLRSTFCGCKYLKNVTIPSTLVSLEHQAFDYCTALEAVYISDLAAWCNISFEPTAGSNPLKFAHRLYLNGVELKDLTIPEGVTHINQQAFIDLTSVEKLTLPSTLEALPSMYSPVEDLGDSFRGCSNLSLITMNGTSEQYYIDNNCVIGRDPGVASDVLNAVMMGCKNSIIPQLSKITSIARHAFCGNRGEFSLNIPSNILYIQNGAFEYCAGLQSVTFPDTNITLGKSAFEYCTGLTSLNLPSNISIDGTTFHNCTSLSQLSGSIHNTMIVANVCNSDGTEIYVTEGGVVDYRNTNVTILHLPNNGISIADSAFSSSKLREIYYDGTMAEWALIPKDPNWLNGARVETIHCTDGDIEL